MNGIIDMIETRSPRGLLKRYTLREYIVLDDARSTSYVQVSGNYGFWSPKGVFIRDSWVSQRRYDNIGANTLFVVLEVEDKNRIADMDEIVELLKYKYDCIEKLKVY